MKTKCTARRKDGNPCQAWAVRGTQPPRCAAHGGSTHPVGAPAGNQNAVKHGFYRKPPQPLASIDDALDHLAEGLMQLADYIRAHAHELTVEEMTRLQAVRGQNLSRFTRMLRDKAAVDGEIGDELKARVDEALRLAEAKLGVEL